MLRPVVVVAPALSVVTVAVPAPRKVVLKLPKTEAFTTPRVLVLIFSELEK